MHNIEALGFDLFNTLITVRPDALDAALTRLTDSLEGNGVSLDCEVFRRDHRQAALRFIGETRRDGRETHNRFWISAALQQQGYSIGPDEGTIAEAVEAYFSAFLDYSTLIPGTAEMLANLKAKYPLGLLSNFTHAPAARRILEVLGLMDFFEVILISGAIGYRKPHPVVFGMLAHELRRGCAQIAYVGDDPEPDVEGALRSGMRPIWMTYVRDRKIPFAPGVASEQLQDVDDRVPRISSWPELLALLKG
ncbi:HAD family hydrolase [Desulfoferrobacter suflitae]|uniref:HAD family hydrolase n=1 Tax=Desulfoferrobacter suflitae TaxID=2865782 RepID=UPI00216401E3|nr:HAD family hydrolase [Desulfoferrobacter suflitae]MCK8602982.1 HAD family hydrolase [Desulfoferrobacter suflitae]